MLLIRLFYERIHLVFIEKHFVRLYISTYLYNLLRESLLRLHVELQEEENLMVPKICNMGAGIIYIPFQVVLINHSNNIVHWNIPQSTSEELERCGKEIQILKIEEVINEKILKSHYFKLASSSGNGW